MEMEYAPGGSAIAAQRKASKVSAKARRKAKKAQDQREKAREDKEVKARMDAEVKARKEEAREAPWREFERVKAEFARVRHLPTLPPAVWGTIEGYLLQACIGDCGMAVQVPPRCYVCSKWFKENTCEDCEHHGNGCPTCDRCDDCDDCEEH
jgi:hypothetical protein